MNDLNKLKKTFDELGIEYEDLIVREVYDRSDDTISYDEDDGSDVTFDRFLRVGKGVGYIGFKCEYYFYNGEYQGHGVWE